MQPHTIVNETNTETLANTFMEQVVLSFGMVAVVDDDFGSKCLHLFDFFCATLKFIL